MRTEKLLDAIGNIDDQLIEEAAPLQHAAKKHINWTRLGSLAACICLFIAGIWAFDFVVSNSLSKSTSVTDTAAPEAVEEETTVEESAETAENTADEETPAESMLEEGASAYGECDIAYGFTMNDIMYYPIAFEDRKHFGLIPEDAIGLTPENTYQIAESDLGEIMGTVETCENGDLIGATVYHFAKFPESDVICIVYYNDSYEFYVSDKLIID